MLTKYLVGKPTRLWDEYLPQALFATRIQVEHARAKANELLLNHAIQSKRLRDSVVKESSLTVGTWVLVRNKGSEKFQPRWFEPYKILKSHSLGTYALEKPGGRVLRNLINGSRLIEANTEDPEGLWSSAALSSALKKKGITIEKSQEIREIIDAYESDDITYSDLSTIIKQEWEEMEASGIRHASVSDETIAGRTILHRRQREQAKRGRGGPRGGRLTRGSGRRKQNSDRNSTVYVSSSAGDSEDGISEVSMDALNQAYVNSGNAQRSGEVSFDELFAVVI
ncbi:hypothetical protein ACJ72_07183 [Emergomyces africanus]|uniref:Uncharacterized protein n=1 Tax=Emergomyces africanus TaxID=1955775 RepID=A0A1B7NNY7_9EURO|nr:hypothetical protein ACJ72_07183 [Emergomyces africanus]